MRWSDFKSVSELPKPGCGAPLVAVAVEQGEGHEEHGTAQVSEVGANRRGVVEIPAAVDVRAAQEEDAAHGGANIYQLLYI